MGGIKLNTRTHYGKRAKPKLTPEQIKDARVRCRTEKQKDIAASLGLKPRQLSEILAQDAYNV